MDNTAESSSRRVGNARQTLHGYPLVQSRQYSQHENLESEPDKLNSYSHPSSRQPRSTAPRTHLVNSGTPLLTNAENQSSHIGTEHRPARAISTRNFGEDHSPYYAKSPKHPHHQQSRPVDFVYHDFAELPALTQPQPPRTYDAHSITSRSARSDSIRCAVPDIYGHDPLVSRVISVGGQCQYRRPSQNETSSPPRRNSSSNWNSNHSTATHRQQIPSGSTKHASRNITTSPSAAYENHVYRDHTSNFQQAPRPFSEQIRGRDLLEERRIRLKGTSHSLADRCLEPQMVSRKNPADMSTTQIEQGQVSGEQQRERHARPTCPPKTSGRYDSNEQLGANVREDGEEDKGRDGRRRIAVHGGLDWDLKPPSTTTINGPYSARKRKRPNDQKECNSNEIQTKSMKNNADAAQFSSNTQTQQIRSQHLPNRFSRALYTNQIFMNQPIASTPSAPFESFTQSVLFPIPSTPLPMGNHRLQFSQYADDSSPIHHTNPGSSKNINVLGSTHLKCGGVPSKNLHNREIASIRHPHSHARQNFVAMRRRRSSSPVENGGSHAQMPCRRSNTNTRPSPLHEALTSVHSNSIVNSQPAPISVSSGDISDHSDGATIENYVENGHLDRSSAYESDGASAVVATLSAASSDPPGPISRKEARLLRLVNSLDQQSRSAHQPPDVIRDPDVQFPDLWTDFSGIPPSAIGDLLQVWDFVTTFSGPLRLSTFKLFHLEQAVTYPDSSSLLETLLICLVRAFVTDVALISELAIPNSVITPLHSKGFTVQSVMQALPNMLSYETDEIDGNDLQDAVQKLHSGDIAFFKNIGASGRLRILRELVDYASMSDVIRECITDTMEFLDEERRKAREDFTAHRKQIESTIKELRNELQAYKLKNGLHQDIANEKDKNTTHTPEENMNSHGETASSSSKSGPSSRREKLQLAQKHRREEEERREKERGMDAIIARIEKARLSLRSLKNSRGRGRVKETDNCIEQASGIRNCSQTESQGDAVRAFPLGMDRMNRCYWFFEGCGRLWIESTKQNGWAVLKSMDSIHQLISWLSPDRLEEVALKTNLTKKLDIFEKEVALETQLVQLADQWVKSNEADIHSHFTRSGKRRSVGDEGNLNKKPKTLVHFLEYRNDKR